METKKIITEEEAKTIGAQLGLKWERFDVNQFGNGSRIGARNC